MGYYTPTRLHPKIVVLPQCEAFSAYFAGRHSIPDLLFSLFLAVFCGFCCLLRFLLLAWMRTAFLAGGNAVVRSGFDRCDFPGMVKGPFFVQW